MTTIPGVLFSKAKVQPGALAIQDGDYSLSYSQTAELVKDMAGKLRAMGLQYGDRFAIWAPNCAEWILAALAGQTLGAVMVTLNTRYKGAEAADILRRSKCKFLFTVSGFLGHDYPAMLMGQDLPDLPDLQEVIVIREGSGQAALERFLAHDGMPVAAPRSFWERYFRYYLHIWHNRRAKRGDDNPCSKRAGICELYGCHWHERERPLSRRKSFFSQFWI